LWQIPERRHVSALAQTIEVGDSTDRLTPLIVYCAEESPLDFVAKPVAKLDGVEFVRTEAAGRPPPQEVASSMVNAIFDESFRMQV